MADQPSFSPDRQKDTEPSPSVIGWLGENIAKPLANGGIEILNAASNIEHLGGWTPEKLQTGKIDQYKIQEAPEGSAAWLAQGFSRNLVTMAAYIGSSTVAGGVLRGLGTTFKAEGTIARVLASNTAANMSGAAFYDYMRDPLPGETTRGNVAGGLAMMGAYSLVGRFMPDIDVRTLVGRATAGAIASPFALTASDVVATGALPTSDQLGQSIQAGFIFGGLMPGGQDLINRGTDKLNIALGRGIPLSRYIDQRNLGGAALRADDVKLPQFAQLQIGEPRVLDMFAHDLPLTRVQPGKAPIGASPSKYLIYADQTDHGPSRAAQVPEGSLTADQQALRADLATRAASAELLGRDTYLSWAADKPIGRSVLSNLGIEEARNDGRLGVRIKDVTGNLVDADKLGPNSRDVHLDTSAAYYPPEGEVVDLSKVTPKSVIAKYAQREPDVKDDGTRGIWLEPEGQAGSRVLLFTQEHMTLPPGPRPEWNGRPPLMLTIDGTSGMGRLFVGVHVTAPNIHNGTDHQITLEVYNSSKNRIFLPDGLKVGQIVVHTLDSYPEGVVLPSTFNGQTTANGDTNHDKSSQTI